MKTYRADIALQVHFEDHEFPKRSENPLYQFSDDEQLIVAREILEQRLRGTGFVDAAHIVTISEVTQ